MGYNKTHYMQDLNFYKYINDKSIWVINKQGETKRLYCPFPVMDYKRKVSTVTSIATGYDNSMYYMIEGDYYRYSFYLISGN